MMASSQKKKALLGRKQKDMSIEVLDITGKELKAVADAVIRWRNRNWKSIESTSFVGE